MNWYVFVTWNTIALPPGYSAAEGFGDRLRGEFAVRVVMMVSYDESWMSNGFTVVVEADDRGSATALVQYMFLRALNELGLVLPTRVDIETRSEVEVVQEAEITMTAGIQVQFDEIVHWLIADGFHPQF